MSGIKAIQRLNYVVLYHTMRHPWYCLRGFTTSSHIIHRNKSLLERNFKPLIWYCASKGYATKGSITKEKKKKSSKGSTSAGGLPDQEEVNEILPVCEMELEMQSILEKMKENYIKQLMLRTNISVFETLEVDTPDGMYPVNQIAQVSKKGPQFVVINVTRNPQYTKSIEKAIMNTGMNLNPQVETSTISIQIPKITVQQREQLVKTAKTLMDAAKKDMQNVRQKYHKNATKIHKKNKLSDDTLKGAEQWITHILSTAVANAEKMFEAKKKDLLNS